MVNRLQHNEAFVAVRSPQPPQPRAKPELKELAAGASAGAGVVARRVDVLTKESQRTGGIGSLLVGLPKEPRLPELPSAPPDAPLDPADALRASRDALSQSTTPLPTTTSPGGDREIIGDAPDSRVNPPPPRDEAEQELVDDRNAKIAAQVEKNGPVVEQRPKRSRSA